MQKILLIGLTALISSSSKAQTPEPKQITGTDENLEYSINAGKSVYAMAVSPDGETLVYSKRSEVVFVNFENGKLIKEIDVSGLTKTFAQRDKIKPYFGYIRALDYTRDGKKLAIGFVGGLVLIDIKNPAIIWYCKGVGKNQGIDSATAVYDVKCSATHVYASSGEDGSLYCWNLADGSLHSKFTTSFKGIENFDITHADDNLKIIISGLSGLEYYKSTGEKIWEKKSRSGGGVMSISPNDSLLAFGTANFGSTVFILNLSNPDKSVNLGPAGDRSPGGVAWSLFKKSVYSCCIGMGNAPVMQYSVVKNETVRTEITKDFDAEPDCNNSCVVGGAGFLLAVAGKNKMINVYKIER
ncbi:MAG: WD40 repeat domain-containing protein [Bacteroidia bacterium]